jgi:hypothetical protein
MDGVAPPLQILGTEQTLNKIECKISMVDNVVGPSYPLPLAFSLSVSLYLSLLFYLCLSLLFLSLYVCYLIPVMLQVSFLNQESLKIRFACYPHARLKN